MLRANSRLVNNPLPQKVESWLVRSIQSWPQGTIVSASYITRALTTPGIDPEEFGEASPMPQVVKNGKSAAYAYLPKVVTVLRSLQAAGYLEPLAPTRGTAETSLFMYRRTSKE